MTLLRYEYFALSCNAKVDNLVRPTCQAESDGMFSDAEAMLAKAKELGWTENGKGHTCPIHSAPTSGPSKRAPKSRDQILDPVVHDGPAGGV